MSLLFRLLLISMLVFSCGKKPDATQSLTATWFANAQSIGFLNVERMALDLRSDSTYRYYFRVAPIPPHEVGEDYTEGGVYKVRKDSLKFTVLTANGNATTYDYGRKFRLLSDTTEWPLRVSYTRQGVDFEVYFQAQ